MSNSPEVIKPYPIYTLSESGKEWLSGINERLASDQITLVDIKGLFVNGSTLDISPSRWASFRKVLADHYGLAPLQTLDTFGYDDDIGAAIELETYNTEPRDTLKEHGNIDWHKLLDPYFDAMARISNSNPFSFSQFVAGVKSSIVHQVIDQARVNVNTEADRILSMTPDEWYRYINGLRFAQEPYADQIRRNGLSHYNRLDEATRRYLFGLSEDQWSRLHSKFGSFQTYEVLKEKSTVTLPEDPLRKIIFNPFSARTKEFVLNDLISPKTKS